MIEHDQNKEIEIEQAKVLLRAAMWVSIMDERGGDKSDILEHEAIVNTIRRFRDEADYKKLVPVFDVALENRKAWKNWGRDMSVYKSELKAMLPNLPLELRQAMYDLAYCVAIRYRERGYIKSLRDGIGRSLKRFFTGKEYPPSMQEYLNISPLEKNALNELALTLEMPQRVIS